MSTQTNVLNFQEDGEKIKDENFGLATKRIRRILERAGVALLTDPDTVRATKIAVARIEAEIRECRKYYGRSTVSVVLRQLDLETFDK